MIRKPADTEVSLPRQYKLNFYTFFFAQKVPYPSARNNQTIELYMCSIFLDNQGCRNYLSAGVTPFYHSLQPRHIDDK